ncbi:hypothetical protein HMPREF3038_01901 [Akkermansia sp. KLE1797]|nr:hypothetical protein HMPREF3038_01901 [Akkermansia sp. KLE1797]KXU54626.1 hypothetical protein HMPREF3039_01097 [Akkermansia sp. KLE1798]
MTMIITEKEIKKLYRPLLPQPPCPRQLPFETFRNATFQRIYGPNTPTPIRTRWKSMGMKLSLPAYHTFAQSTRIHASLLEKSSMTSLQKITIDHAF